jgi:hypothetical protein
MGDKSWFIVHGKKPRHRDPLASGEAIPGLQSGSVKSGIATLRNDAASLLL